MQPIQTLRKIPTPTYLFGIVLVGYFFFTLSHLGSFVTADEGKWTYERIPQYWQAWEQGQLDDTFINDKPGVTLALLGLPASLLYPDATQHCLEEEKKIIHCQVGESRAFLITHRLPIVFLNGIILVFLFFVISKITNAWVSLWSSLLIGLSPPLIGISQIVNPDALLWSFGSASLFAFFWYLKSGLRRAVIFSGVFLGFALLSKYVALLLLPFYGGVIVLRFLLLQDEELPEPRNTLKKDLVALSSVVVVSVSLLILFLPALILDGDRVVDFLATIEGKAWLFSGSLFLLVCFLGDFWFLQSRILFRMRDTVKVYHFLFSWLVVGIGGLFGVVMLARVLFPEWGIFSIVRFDLKELTNAVDFIARELYVWEALLLNMSPVVYALTPITLLGLFLLVVEMRKKRLTSYYFFAISLALFLFLYEAILLFTNVFSTIRYSIILYPCLAFLSALGFWHYTRKIPYRHRELLITIILFIASLWSVFMIKPFYFNYTNSFLPKSQLITDAWGYGGYEAAQYLNTLPQAEQLTVWSDYYGVCEFFVGQCLTAYNFDKENVKPDYYVLTRRGRIRYWSRYETWEERSGLTAYQYYDRENPDWQLLIGGKAANAVKVFRVQK